MSESDGIQEELSDNKPNEIDPRSVFVGSVDYGSKPDELKEVFAACGEVTRVTILSDPRTGRPRGYAYVEFKSQEGTQAALKLNGTLFRDRELRVVPKRANVPGLGRNRGRFKRGRGRIPMNPHPKTKIPVAETVE
ncbi:unnamed protein product [Kuraishia capsulata CBS 1993]|uniref:RRM domain-containing protein n=1 Tax=Kuraishia capsulata CBS 1993 TaxID=1382522 RepID=W6MIV3_9ASCO|nr:uncharacterized protein KUCA_T00001844001 [Kuraishia capsulata CBS 1993]CDK25873.1 unnamed protein product [Kuraishia capsulata CBS 1993]